MKNMQEIIGAIILVLFFVACAIVGDILIKEIDNMELEKTIKKIWRAKSGLN